MEPEMPFTRPLQRSWVYGACTVGVLLVTGVVVLGFHSTASAMLAEATLQQCVFSSMVQIGENASNTRFIAGNLSRRYGD
jgi:hypothetical protein